MRRNMLLLLLGILIGIFAHAALVNPRPNMVTIKNNASRNIKLVLLSQENENKKNIPAGQSAEIQFYTRGESSYTLLAEFDNGKQVRGGSGYIEPGYKELQVVTDDGIRLEH